MKKKILLILSLFFVNLAFPTTHTITNSGLTFTPNTLNVNVGDTVKFVIASVHTARQVSQSTWNANGITSNGGFDLPFGGGTIVVNQPGTIYYVCVPHASQGMKGTITVNTVTGVDDLTQIIPDNFILMQNYPNPFNPSTKISYGLTKPSNISLKIYDILGNEIRELVNKTQSAGFYEINFNANNLSSGIYYYKMIAISTDSKNLFTNTKKLILLK